MRVFTIVGFLAIFITSCTAGIKTNNKFTDKASIKKIIVNYKKWDNQEVGLTVKIGGRCYNIKRNGGVCLTDGTASIAAYGKLPKALINHREENRRFLHKVKNSRLCIKGIVKFVVNKQFVLKVDNVINGRIKCSKLEYEPGKYNKICSIKGGEIVYIFVTSSHWNAH